MLSWLPENIASYGARIDAVMTTIYYIVGAWFVLAEFILIFFILRYRRKPGVRAAYVPANNMKTLAWVLIPSFMVLGFDLAMDHQQAPVWKEIKEEMPPSEMLVRVKGRQFVWEITDAGPDHQLDTPDDVQNLNQMTIPVDTTVHLQLEAEDVLHSFWVPNMRFKQDVVPGRRIQGWFKAIKTGDYKLACAELCGVGHGNMGGWLHVVSKDDYQKWVNKK